MVLNSNKKKTHSDKSLFVRECFILFEEKRKEKKRKTKENVFKCCLLKNLQRHTNKLFFLHQQQNTQKYMNGIKEKC